MANKNLRE